MKNFKLIFAVFIVVSCALFYIYWSRLAHGEMIVYFLDVGQGDSVLIETPSDKIILIDGGPGTEVLTELDAVLPFFKKDIDLLVLTHPHDDHIQGLVPVSDRYKIDSALITGVAYESAYYDEFLKNLREGGTVIYFADENSDFKFDDGVFVDVLYPFESISGESFEDLNDSSIVMRISYWNESVLLAGDCTEKIEQKLIASGENLDSDIFKASHHGSKYSNSLNFLETISPDVVVISVGENDFGHPTEEALEIFSKVGAKVYRTDQDGIVRIE